MMYPSGQDNRESKESYRQHTGHIGVYHCETGSIPWKSSLQSPLKNELNLEQRKTAISIYSLVF